MRKFIVCRGVPGSGKSFLAGSLLTKYPKASILSTDDYFVCEDGYKFDRRWLETAHAYTYYQFICACQSDVQVIVLDNTNTTWKEFSRYVERALYFGYEIEIMEPNTPWKNDVEECFIRNLHGVPKETIQRMMDRFQSSEDIWAKINELRGNYGK